MSAAAAGSSDSRAAPSLPTSSSGPPSIVRLYVAIHVAIHVAAHVDDRPRVGEIVS